MVVGVFQQTGRPDGYRTFYGIEKGQEIADELVWQFGSQEIVQDLFVGNVGKGYLVQVVGLHEFVEHVGTQHDGFGDGNAGVFVIVQYGIPFDK